MNYSQIDKSKILETLTVLTLVFLGLGFMSWYKNEVFPIWTVGIAILCLLLGLFVPLLSKPITWLWFKVGEMMGLVSSKIILGFLFFFIIVPYSYIYRLFNPNELKGKKRVSTFFTERNYKFSNKDMENPW